MGTFSLIWGICAILGMMLAMIPLLGGIRLMLGGFIL